jgi:hypothetical protein
VKNLTAEADDIAEEALLPVAAAAAISRWGRGSIDAFTNKEHKQ